MEIFDLIKKQDNLKFSSLKNLDLIQIIDSINNYNLTYRSILGISKEVTFGCELEFEYSKNHLIKEELRTNNLYQDKDNDGYLLTRDSTLTKGGEIKSPILYDDEKLWQEFQKVCEITRKNATISSHSSSHVHIGYNIIHSREELINLLRLYSCYENVLYRFLYGEFYSNRAGVRNYAAPCRYRYLDYIDHDVFLESCYIEKIIKRLYESGEISRYLGLNLMNAKDEKNHSKNTMEFRIANGTLEETIWQNNINALTKLVLTKEYDLDLINNRINNLGNNIDYTDIDLDAVLEFVDVIFDNNLDKVYFLRQYFKDFDNAYKPMVKAKRFIK